MSSQDVTTTGMMDLIRILATTPNNSQLNSDDDTLLNLLNFEMTSCLVPQIMSVREEYFVQNYDFQTYQQTSGIWQDYYPMPSAAVGGKLRDLTILISTGASTPPQMAYIPQLTPEQIAGIGYGSFYGNGSLSFYVRGNGIVLFPCPTSAITLRMSYYNTPNYLVSTSEAGQVLSINSNNNTVVLSNVPSDWSTSDSVDVIQSYQPFDFDAQDVAITSLSSPTVGLASVSGIQVGDWVALTGDSPIAQLPLAAQPVLIQAVVIKLLESLKDVDGVDIAQKKYNELFQALKFMIGNGRVQGEPPKITGGGRALSDFMRARRGWGGYYR